MSLEVYDYDTILKARETNAQLEKIFDIVVYILLIEHSDTKAVTEALIDSNPRLWYDSAKLQGGLFASDVKKFKAAYNYHLSPEIKT